MNSPIVLIIVWFVINLLIKSAKDKKKIEEARRKRATQIENGQRNISSKDINRETLQKDVRKAISTIREEIEKQYNMTTTNKDSRQDIVRQETKKEVPKTAKNINNKGTYRDDRKEVTPVVKSSLESQVIKSDLAFQSREDIIKGIIFSEILSEPKSIQNLKRSI